MDSVHNALPLPSGAPSPIKEYQCNNRFFVLKRVEDSLKNVSAILIHKSIIGMIGEPKSVKKCNSGDVLVEVSNPKQAERIINMKTIGQYAITVSPHLSLNRTRGVISESDLQFDSENDILDSLKDQHVIEVCRINMKRDNKLVPTKHIKLTFDLPALPKSVKIAYLNCPVRPFIPNPMRCFKCQRFGHTMQNCRGKETCAQCSVAGHESKGCTSAPTCVNCKGDHPSYYRTCPRWKEEKEILTIKVTQNITYPEARKLVKDRTPKIGISYAETIKKLFCDKAANSGTSATEFIDKKVEEKKILNIDNNGLEKEVLKSQPDKMKNTLVKNEAVIAKLMEDCLKKDAVIEYLSKEKNTIQKTCNSFEDALNDSVSRLKEAAEIYKKQYVEIENLKKKLEKAKTKCKERDSSANSCIKDETSTSGEIKDVPVSESAKPTQNSSDSDTGEHVLGHSSEINKKMVKTIAIAQENNICEKTPSEMMGEKLQKMNEEMKDISRQTLDAKHHVIASAPTIHTPEENRQLPELQTMIDQNLIKLSLSGSKEEEIQFSLPCPICDVDIGIYSSSTEEMIKHLEIQHKQQICPVCEKFFDMTLPQKYFQFHVEDHFQKGK